MGPFAAQPSIRGGWRGHMVAMVLALAVVVCGGGWGATSAAAATDFTWSGATPNGLSASNWSLAGNWGGGAAPSGAVGTLTFPALTAPACSASTPTATCYMSNNDVSNISATAISLDGPYFLEGNGVTLGSGGLTASNATNSSISTDLSLPVTLSASQTWSVGAGDNLGVVGSGTIGGRITGTTQPLAIDGGGTFFDGADIEVGSVTVSNADVDLGVFGYNGSYSLNGSDGNPVAFTNSAGLQVRGSPTIGAGSPTIGALSMSGQGHLTFEEGSSLGINGGATLSSSNEVDGSITQAGTAPGTDYSQVTASGNVNLGGGDRSYLWSHFWRLSDAERR